MDAIPRARQLWRQWLCGGIALAALLASFLGPAGAQESNTLRLTVGATRIITLKENPSTGYGWQINTAASKDLSRVGIADAGFVRDSTLIGAPGQRRISITAREPGTAVAVFDYARPWENLAPARRHAVTIKIGR